MDHPNKVALITGAARRVGAVITSTLHQHGMNVIIHYRQSAKEALALCAQLNEQRINSAVALQADLLHTSALADFITKAANTWGRLDALINSASDFHTTTMGKATENEWDNLINTNLKAPFFLTQAAASWLSQHQGCVVNITDIHGQRPLAGYSIYSISKAGLLMLTKSLAKEYGSLIRVNAVAPGLVCLPEKANALDELTLKKIIANTSLKRPGTPIDVAKAVLFFIADADYVTGQVLNVDGGRLSEI